MNLTEKQLKEAIVSKNRFIATSVFSDGEIDTCDFYVAETEEGLLDQLTDDVGAEEVGDGSYIMIDIVTGEVSKIVAYSLDDDAEDDDDYDDDIDYALKTVPFKE